MGSSTNSDPEETAQGQSSEPSREHGTDSQNIEDTLNRFRALQEQQIDLLRGFLGQPTPIRISIPISPEPEDPWDWDHELCVPHPCYCCRSRPRYRQIFGFDEGVRLQREKDLKRKKDPEANRVWIKEDLPSGNQQKQLRDSFINSLPTKSNRNIVQWPQGTVMKSESPLDIKWANQTTKGSKKTKAKPEQKDEEMIDNLKDQEMRDALKEVWPLFEFPSFEAAGSSESIERSEGMDDREDDSGEGASVHTIYRITKESAAEWEVITTGLDRVESSTNEIIYQVNENSDKMVCGRYVKCVRQHSDFMNLEQIALFCCLFSNIIDDKAPGIVALVQFLQAYTSAWEPTKKIKVESDRVFFQQFHFRYPEVCFDSETDKLNPSADHHDNSGIKVFRDQGCMPKNPSPSPRQSVVERRVSILFATTNVGDSRPWKIFSFEDGSVYSWKTASKSMEELLRQDTEKQPSERFFALLNTLRQELESCAGFWERTLDRLEQDLRIRIDKVTDATTLKKWMFDDDQNERSALYFECLVMLQIFADWVEDTSRDLASAVSAIPSEYSPALGITHEEIKGIEAGVDAFLKEIEDAFGPISGRIKQTNKEIIVLRDGMFNSTSIREAREATQQGHYILVFTVITIVYLPLAFVTGFFGMNNLENVNNSLLMSWTPFIIVFTVVASVTYIMAGLSIPWVHRNDIFRRGVALKEHVLQSHGKPNKKSGKRRSLVEMMRRSGRRNRPGRDEIELA